MPTKPTKNKSQIATQITTELLDAFRSYAQARGETLSAALERAMRREMTYPPPAEEVPPLPDSPAVAVEPPAQQPAGQQPHEPDCPAVGIRVTRTVRDTLNAIDKMTESPYRIFPKDVGLHIDRMLKALRPKFGQTAAPDLANVINVLGRLSGLLKNWQAAYTDPAAGEVFRNSLKDHAELLRELLNVPRKRGGRPRKP